MHNFVYLAQRRSQEFSCEPNFGGGRAPPPGCASSVSARILALVLQLCERNKLKLKLKLSSVDAFSVCGPDIWNSLTVNVRLTVSHVAFRCAIKTHLFNSAFIFI